MGNEYKLTIEENVRIYNDEIKQLAFRHVRRAEEIPTVYIIGGQPAAGKSKVLDKAFREVDCNAVIINGDDYRKFHPEEKEIYERFGHEGSKYTHPDCAKWAVDAMKEARSNKYNVILENTLRSSDITYTINNFKNNGYRVEIKILAVNELESLAGIYHRYEDQLSIYNNQKDPTTIPRFTPLEYHDNAYTSMLSTVEKIEQDGIADLKIYNRKGDLLYDSTDNPQSRKAVDIIIETRNTPWLIEKYQQYIMENEKLINQMVENKENTNHIAIVKDLTNRSEKTLTEIDKRIYTIIREIKDSNADINTLKSNSPTKELYSFYAKKAMEGAENIWESLKLDVGKGTDFEVAKQMLESRKFSSCRIREVLKQSPSISMLTIERTKRYKIASQITRMAQCFLKTNKNGIEI